MGAYTPRPINYLPLDQLVKAHGKLHLQQSKSHVHPKRNYKKDYFIKNTFQVNIQINSYSIIFNKFLQLGQRNFLNTSHLLTTENFILNFSYNYKSISIYE